MKGILFKCLLTPDNKQRDPKMDTIKIDIKPEENLISIMNNGKGIPVVEHKDEKMFVPTMIFGHLLTSSNFNDEQEKVTGGRNGFGAKLCNVFSTKFTVETADKKVKKSFKQTWASNMSKVRETKIVDNHMYSKVFIPYGIFCYCRRRSRKSRTSVGMSSPRSPSPPTWPSSTWRGSTRTT